MEKRNEKKHACLNAAAAAACAMLGMILLAISMKRGAGIGGDATIYLTSARNLIAGKGLGLVSADGAFRLIPYFPPFYSLVLALFALLGADLSTAAMLLNLCFHGGLVFAVCCWTLRHTRSLIPGVLIGVLLACSPILIPAYSWAMSEPLCTLLGFLGLILLVDSFNHGRNAGFWLSAVLMGLSFLTRYSSAAFIAAAVLMIFFFEQRTFARRFADAFLYGMSAVLPMIVWLVIDYRLTDTVASRSMLEGQTAALWAAFVPKFMNVLQLWVVPESLQGRLPAFLLNGIAALFLLFPPLLFLGCLFCKGKKTGVRWTLMTLSLFSVCYALLILCVSLNTYPPITINTRMLLPLYVAELWAAFLLLGQVRGKGIRMLLYLLAAAFVGISSLRGVRIARQNAIDGLGYNSAAWQSSETVDWVKANIPADSVIVTNEETALLYLLGRVTYPVHEVYVTEPDAEYYAYESETKLEGDSARRAFRAGGAYLVIFDSFEDQMADIYADDTNARIEALFANLNLVYDGDDGKVYTLRDAE